MFLGLFSNLIFHARQTWPASRAAITQLFSEYLAQMYSEQSSSSLAGANAICSAFGFCANAMLYFVAWPSTAEPFKNLADQETSQATILKFMATGCTPLELNNFGYRAIAMTQLMQSKTPEEEIWAKLKTLSWPPWKEDKTGMDASIGPEYGVSRAAQTLDQARAAGYGNHAWEQVARLHAGWDTDLTPTVQLRYLVRPFNPSQEEANIWSARIRSTRTLREAWAGFLAYQDSGSSLHPPVYSTMLEKILRDITRQHSIGGREDTSDSALVRKDPNTAASEQHRDTLPGDSLEVSAPPPSAHLETYTRTEPPSVAQFLDLMLTNSVQFGDSTLGYLLSIVPDWESGKLLLSSRPELSDIVNERHWLSARMSGAKLSPKIAKALVAFLLRFPSQGQLSDTGLLDGIKVGEWTLHGRAVSLAVQLLRSGATDTTLGKHLLLALAHSRGFTPVDTGLSKAHLEDLGLVLIPDDIAGGGALHYKALIDRIVALDIALEVEDYRRQHHVPISPVELRAWFTVAGNAGSAAQTLIRKLDAAQASDSTEDTLSPTADRTLRSLATLCLDKICTVIRPHFFSTLEVTDLTSTPSTTQPTHSLLPRLYLVPNHHVLHAFVRALAVANDYPGLLQLTRFMSVYWPELHARLIQDRKGVHIFQRALISLRAALLLGHEGFERRERQPDFYALLKRRGKDGAAPREVQEEIRGVVLGMARDQEEWVWPSVEMVVGYLEHGSRQLERGRKGKRGRRG
ncbi:hypothetical protein ANO11243_055260 [Dothideomycetidae sp. 11243]|nr:hypothetical protein ANO11243_055260 [fungal sp. No.11243]